MFCTKCGKENPKKSNFCKYCGTKFAASGKSDEPLTPDREPYPYVISIKKLIILYVLTFGIYQLVWFYKQFRSLKFETDWKVGVVARAIFSNIMAYSLFRRVNNELKEIDEKKTLRAGWLAIAFAVFISTGFLPDPYWFIGLLSFIPLIPVQKAINTYWETKYPERVVRSKFGAKNIVWSTIGSIILLLALLGSLYTAYGVDKNGNDTFFTSLGPAAESDSLTKTELTAEKLVAEVNRQRKKNNVKPLTTNAWVCEVAKLRLEDIHTKGVATFDNTAALQRAMDETTTLSETSPALKQDIEPAMFSEIYTYQETVEKAVSVWAEYSENDFLTSEQYEFGCAAVSKGYGVLITGYGDMAEERARYEETDASL